MGPLRQLRATLRAITTHPANRGHAVRAIGRFAGWQFWERLTHRPRTIDFQGLRLVCFPHEYASSAVIYNRLPDWDEMNFIKAFLRPGDVFVDVGANVGVYTLLAAATPDVKVVAFEPSTSAFARLDDNVSVNGLHKRVDAIKAAVGADTGVAVLTTDLGTMNRLGDGAGAGEEVEVLRVDDFVGLAPTFMKIDVEGFELDVLLGAEQTIQRCHPAMLIEVNDRDGLRAWLQAHGYEAFRYATESRQLVPSEVGDAANVIAIHDVASATERLAGSAR